ncbi:MAG TPA: PPC domain-containing protein, partial [Allosphingosinicella sp.]|nr:PPC domain-containing protein [Allosphingosinicella sp.]
MSARDRSTIAANSALVKDGTWLFCSADAAAFKSALGGFASSETLFALADPALRVPSQILVPGTILLTDTINPPGDFDVFALNVVAGRTYMLSVYGSGTSPLQDSIIALFDNGFSLVDLDDDGGSSTNSLLTFTAAYTGQYFIDVEAFPGSGLTGQYTLDVILQPLTDVVDSTFANAVLIAPGVSYGFVDSPVPDVYGGLGETDTFKINMTAGKYYTIEVAGGADYDSDFTALPAGELDPIIFLYDSSGNLVASNDDISFPSDISSRIGFLAETTGTYYLDVQSY